jgi:hypothetical protein
LGQRLLEGVGATRAFSEAARQRFGTSSQLIKAAGQRFGAAPERPEPGAQALCLSRNPSRAAAQAHPARAEATETSLESPRLRAQTGDFFAVGRKHRGENIGFVGGGTDRGITGRVAPEASSKAPGAAEPLGAEVGEQSGEAKRQVVSRAGGHALAFGQAFGTRSEMLQCTGGALATGAGATKAAGEEVRPLSASCSSFAEKAAGRGGFSEAPAEL